MKNTGNHKRQGNGGWLNNRAENSQLPFRRRERVMLRFGKTRCLQNFAAVQPINGLPFPRRLMLRMNFVNRYSLLHGLVTTQRLERRRSFELALKTAPLRRFCILSSRLDTS